MSSIYKYIILVSMIKILNCAEFNSCPSFNFSSNGTLQAKMEVPTPNNHNNSIKFHIELSIGSNVTAEDLNNKLLFLGTPDDITNKRPLVFSLELPIHWNNFNTKISTISINDEKLCSSDHLDIKNFKIISNINRSIMLKITTSTSKPSSTLHPESNTNNYTITQSPTTVKYIYTPIPTQPFKHSFQSSNCYKSSQSKLLISNGDDAEKEMYPWIGALVVRKNGSQDFQCGATLITEKLALTAGHCIAKNLENELYLIFGTNNIQDLLNDEVQFAKVTNYAIHPQYKSYTSDADIAILQMSKELYFTSSVRPICLCNFEECFEKIKNLRGVVAGWGIDENNKFANTLKQIYIGMVTEEDCLRSSTSFNDITTNRTFCAGDKNGKGPCNGDSGSGFYMLVQGRWTIRGIVSRALLTNDGRCDLSQYVVYVDVAQHLDWINQYL